MSGSEVGLSGLLGAARDDADAVPDVADHPFAVEDHGHAATDALVVEGREALVAGTALPGDEAVARAHVHPVERPVLALPVGLLAGLVVLRRGGREHVALAVAVRDERREVVRHRLVAQAIERRARAPEEVVAHEHDVLAGSPLPIGIERGELEAARAHQEPGRLVDLRGLELRVEVLRQHVDAERVGEVREERLVEDELDGLLVDDLDVLDHVERRARSLGLDLRVEDELLNRPSDVFGRHRHAVAEAGVVADPHPHPQTIGIPLPRRGEPAAKGERLGVVGGERIDHLVDHATAVDVGREVGHELRGLVAEDLRELAADAEARHVLRRRGEHPRLLPVDRDTGAGPRVVAATRGGDPRRLGRHGLRAGRLGRDCADGTATVDDHVDGAVQDRAAELRDLLREVAPTVRAAREHPGLDVGEPLLERLQHLLPAVAGRHRQPHADDGEENRHEQHEVLQSEPILHGRGTAF